MTAKPSGLTFRMQQKKRKINWLERDLITGPYLCLVLSQEEFEQALDLCDCKTYFPWVSENADASTHTLENPEGKICCIVALQVTQENDPVEICGILVHEAVHVFQNYCETIGEKNPSSEFEAYSIQAISQRLMAEYRDRIAA